MTALRQLIQAVPGRDVDGPSRVAGSVEEMARALARWDQALRIYRAIVLETAGQSAAAHVALAAAYLERGNGPEALKEARAAGALDPSRADAAILQGLAFDLARRPVDAAQAFARASKIDKSSAAASYGLAQRLIVTGDEAGARVALRQFEAGQPADGPPSSVRRAAAAPFVRAGLLRQPAGAAPLFPPASFVRGFALLADGVLDQAVVELRAAAALRQDKADAPPDSEGGSHYQLALQHQSAGRNRDAIRELEQAARFPPVVGQDHLYDLLGVLYTADADLDGALAAYRRRVLVNPNDGDAHRKLGQIYLEQSRQEEASAEFTAALLIDPSNADAWAGRAQIRLRLGDYAAAAKWARRAVAINPAHQAAQYTLGTSLLRLGQVEEGTAVLETFTRLQAAAQAAADREWQLRLLKQSAQSRLDAGDLDGAVAVLEQVAARQPDAAVNHTNLGLVLQRAGRQADAIAAYRRALEVSPDADVHGYLAVAYAALGRDSESRAEQALSDLARGRARSDQPRSKQE